MTDRTFTIADRRDRLAVAPNPDERQDCIVSLEGEDGIAGPDRPVKVTLVYVPDRVALSPDAFGAYLETLDGYTWPSLEAAAVAILADVNNELIPRWVQVRLIASPGARVARHSVVLEDRQPGWNDPAFLSRVAQG